MADTLIQTAYMLEESFLIYLTGKKYISTTEQALSHSIYLSEKLVVMAYDLINGIYTEDDIEGEYKPESEFGQILQIFIRAFKLAATSKNEKVKNESKIIMLKILRKIIEIISEYADRHSPNIYGILSDLENINNVLKELEKQS
jgi:hypothetical protein